MTVATNRFVVARPGAAAAVVAAIQLFSPPSTKRAVANGVNPTLANQANLRLLANFADVFVDTVLGDLQAFSGERFSRIETLSQALMVHGDTSVANALRFGTFRGLRQSGVINISTDLLYLSKLVRPLQRASNWEPSATPATKRAAAWPQAYKRAAVDIANNERLYRQPLLTAIAAATSPRFARRVAAAPQFPALLGSVRCYQRLGLGPEAEAMVVAGSRNLAHTAIKDPAEALVRVLNQADCIKPFLVPRADPLTVARVSPDPVGAGGSGAGLA